MANGPENTLDQGHPRGPDVMLQPNCRGAGDSLSGGIPRPDHGEDSYRGSGRLEGRRAFITVGIPASNRATHRDDRAGGRGRHWYRLLRWIRDGLQPFASGRGGAGRGGETFGHRYRVSLRLRLMSSTHALDSSAVQGVLCLTHPRCSFQLSPFAPGGALSAMCDFRVLIGYKCVAVDHGSGDGHAECAQVDQP